MFENEVVPLFSAKMYIRINKLKYADQAYLGLKVMHQGANMAKNTDMEDLDLEFRLILRHYLYM